MELVDREHGSEMTVDLEQQLIVAPGGEAIPFQFDPFTRQRLLNGWDDIGLTLRHEGSIAAYEAAHRPLAHTLTLPR
jgi:3-isopropylmalate/(R)-2-methylmalate dehydratase small subunit